MPPGAFYQTPISRQILVFLGALLLLFVLAQLVAATLIMSSGMSLQEVMKPQADHPNANTIRYILLASQGIISVLIFMGSSWLTLRWGMFAHFTDLNAAPTFTIKQASWVLLLIMVSFPAIGYISQWNQAQDFGFLGNGMSKYIVDKEKELAEVTRFLVNVDSAGQFMMLILVVSVIAGISEEMLFRGIIQNMVHRSTANAHVAIWATAFLFGAIHFQFQTMLPRVLLGALLGYVYVWSGSLYLAMAGHFMNNFITAIGMVSIQRYGLSEDSLEQAPVWAALLSLVALVAGMLLFKKQVAESRTLHYH